MKMVSPEKHNGASLSSSSTGAFQAQILDAMAQPVIATDVHGAVTYWNRAAEELCGWTSDEVLGRDVVEVMTTDSTHGPAQNIMDGVRDGRSWTGELLVHRRDGSAISALITASPFCDAGGMLAGLVGTVTDISEQKRVNEDILQTRSGYERLVNHLDGIVWEGSVDVASGKFTFTLVSEQLREILGYEPQSWIEDASRWVAAIHAEDRSWAPAACMAASRDRHNHALEYRMVRADGGVVWLRDLVHVVDTDGDVVTSAGVMIDITEQKEAERTLLAAKEKAEELARLKSAFLANMSHEIRTPLTSIIGFAEILEADPTSEVTAKAQLIRGAGHRLMMTLDSVMDFAQLESGALRLDATQLDVVAQVRDLRSMFEQHAQQKGLYLKFDCDRPQVLAYADAGALFRVLSNLVSNAIKFTTEGGVCVKVREAGDYVFIDVVDTGIGVAEDFQPRLFEEFKQESEGFSRNYEGVGLGLSITKRLVDLMGGTIIVTSRKNAGSTFSVRLPTRVSRSEVGGTTSHVNAEPRPRVASILVVEDQDDAQHLLRHLLRPTYHVDLATTAEDALAAAEGRAYDLIIMDINLGGTSRNGSEVLKVLRQWPAYAAVPVVACTAYALPGDEERFIAEGFDAYLGKPFRKSDLYNLLTALLPDDEQ